MKKALILAFALILLTGTQVNAYSVYSRYAHTGTAGEVTIYYTVIISKEEFENLEETLTRLLAEIIYKVYPREDPALKGKLAAYYFQIAITESGRTTGYFEFPLLREIIDQILEETGAKE